MSQSRDQIRRAKIVLEAEGYVELGMAQHALDALSQLGDPTQFDAHELHLWGEALRELEQYEEALVPLGQASEFAPRNIHVWLAMAWCYKRTDQVELAIDAMRRAVAIDPAEPILRYNLACYWSLVGDRPQALECLSQAFEIDPHLRSLVPDEPDFDQIRTDPKFQALCSKPQPADGSSRYC